MSIDLFTSAVHEARQHQIFKRLMEDQYAPERATLQSWAEGFNDRDGKFVQEFQLTFESSFWELYLHAVLRELGLVTDMSFDAPDFVVVRPHNFSIEATIAGPPNGGKPAFAFDAKEDIPRNLTEFNIQSALRICNAFDAKVKRYRNRYASLPQSRDKPYVIAIGSFDRPYAHFATNRSIIAALYGLYFDEEATARDAIDVVSYNVSAAPKTHTIDVPVGLFCDDRYSEVSAVIYSPVATWGKLRALADNPLALTVYQTYHPNRNSLIPQIRTCKKAEYQEHLVDGLYVLHNPFARHPLPVGAISHPRLCELKMDSTGELIFKAPDDFLLLRMLQSVVPRS